MRTNRGSSSHMRTNRCTGRKRTNAQPNTRTRLPEVQSVANCVADENVKPHMRIPSSPLIMRKSPVCTGTMPRSSNGSHPSPTCPESSCVQFQVNKRVSSTPKWPYCTMTSSRRADARPEARRSQLDHSRDQVVVALVVRTPIDTHCWAYTQCTDTQNLQIVKSSHQLDQGPRVRCARRAQLQKRMKARYV